VNFEKTSLPGVVRIVPTVYTDSRGYFIETWHSRRFSKAGVAADFVQDNLSYSSKGVLRGLHYQVQQAQGKLVRVVSGEIFDVAIDLRRSSQNFGRWVGEHLSAENKHQLWLPPGFGHGFLVLSDTAEVAYKCTDFYAPEHERSIRWDDPDIGIDWPLPAGEKPELSDKDASAPCFKDAETYA